MKICKKMTTEEKYAQFLRTWPVDVSIQGHEQEEYNQLLPTSLCYHILFSMSVCKIRAQCLWPEQEVTKEGIIYGDIVAACSTSQIPRTMKVPSFISL
jgi:hypothetical protein